jgi:hypothetical protein
MAAAQAAVARWTDSRIPLRSSPLTTHVLARSLTARSSPIT